MFQKFRDEPSVIGKKPCKIGRESSKEMGRVTNEVRKGKICLIPAKKLAFYCAADCNRASTSCASSS